MFLLMGSSNWSTLSNVVIVGLIRGVAASSATFNARSTACLSGCHNYASSLG